MEHSGFILNWVDYVIVIVVFVSMTLGFFTGLVMQLAGIFSIVGGLLLYWFASPIVADALHSRWIGSELTAKFVANILCFFIGSTLVRFIAHLLRGVIKRLSLTKLDHFFGMSVGALKGVFFCTIILIISGRSGIDNLEAPARDSFFGGKIVAMADNIVAWAKDEKLVDKSKKVGNEIYQKSKKIITKVKEKIEKKQTSDKEEKKKDIENSE